MVKNHDQQPRIFPYPAEVYLGPHQTSMLELFVKTVNDFKPLIIFANKLHRTV